MPVKRWSKEHRARFEATMAMKREAIPHVEELGNPFETYDIREMSAAQIRDFHQRRHHKTCLELKIKFIKECKDAGVTFGAVMTTPLNGLDD